MAKIKPNGYDCSSCPHWDDVNGCWADVDDILGCPGRDLEGNIIEEDDYEEEMHEM